MDNIPLANVKQLVNALPAKQNLQLIAVTHSTNNGWMYAGRMISFKPSEGLVHLTRDIVKSCTGEKKPSLPDGAVAEQFDGSGIDGRLSYLDVSDPLVCESWTAFEKAMCHVSRELNPTSHKTNATVLTSTDKDFYLISVQAPFLSFNRRRVFFGKTTFREIKEDENILTFSPRLDAIVFQEKMVFFSSQGSSFFVSNSAMLKRARETASIVAKMGIVSNIDEFMKAVEVPRNAHWLLAVDAKRLEKIAKDKTRKHVSEVFGLKYSGGRFSTETRGEIASLLKVLGKRGMLDVVENIPVEVSGSGAWKPEA